MISTGWGVPGLGGLSGAPLSLFGSCGSLSWANAGSGSWLLVVGVRWAGMTNNQAGEMLTTAEAAKVLGVRTDAVHAMKAEGRLTVVGKGPHGTNLFAVAEIQAAKVKREQVRRVIPGQVQLPGSDEDACGECAAWRARALAAEAREQRAKAALRAALDE